MSGTIDPSVVPLAGRKLVVNKSDLCWLDPDQPEHHGAFSAVSWPYGKGLRTTSSYLLGEKPTISVGGAVMKWNGRSDTVFLFSKWMHGKEHLVYLDFSTLRDLHGSKHTTLDDIEYFKNRDFRVEGPGINLAVASS